MTLPRQRIYRVFQDWHLGNHRFVRAHDRREAIKKAGLPGAKTYWLAWCRVVDDDVVVDEYDNVQGKITV